MSYQHVLAAIDTTDEARLVLSAARRVADQDQAKLACVTVLKPLASVYGGMDLAGLAASHVPFEQDAMRQAEEKTLALAAEFGIAKEDVHVELGSPVAGIKAKAEALDTDLIVIGTHGQHGLGLLLGSTANGVLHGVPCDTLVVRIHDD